MAISHRSRCRALASLPLLAAAFACPPSAHAENAPFTGTWRFTRAVVAPWVDAGTPPIVQPWLGRWLWVGPNTAGGDGRQVNGPDPLQCTRAQFEPTRVPAEGLFQGGLPAPARAAALALGLPDGEVPGVSLACTTGLFEFHYADADTLLVAVDNVVWTLDRTPGTEAAQDAPEGVLQRMLEAHFAGDMAFTAASAAAKRAWLTDALWRAIEHWQAQPQPEDEVPAIDGDVFTDSQEYPVRFSVGAARAEATQPPAATAAAGTPRMLVDVMFDFVGTSRPVTYVLEREAGAWRVADLRYADGGTLLALLR